MNQFCTFYIVRHGQTEANIQQLFNGQTETNLSEKGIQQAHKRAEDLKRVHFDAVFSSDLSRARRTAEIIAKEHQLAVVALEVLREKEHGILEGKKRDSLEEDMRKLLDEYTAMSHEKRWSYRPFDGMETDEEVIGRLTTFLRETALGYANKTVLIVTHGGVMRDLLVHVGFVTRLELPHGSLKNTGYFILKSDGVEFEVVKTVGIEKKTT